MSGTLERLRRWASGLKSELAAIHGAALDPRTPWYAKALALLVIGYALSPIDLIPDFIPVLGHLDDLLLVPLGLWTVLKLIPPAVVDEHRARVAGGARLPRSKTAAVVIVALWIASCVAVGLWLWRRMGE
jgi:uncharacterized membrane protein YkvA (DUF1232 family)